MKTYFLTFFFFNRRSLTFEADSPTGLIHQLETNRDFLLELMSGERETDIMFYSDPASRCYWLIESAIDLDDAVFNLTTHDHKIKLQGVKQFWTI